MITGVSCADCDSSFQDLAFLEFGVLPHGPEGSKYPTIMYLPKTILRIPNMETLSTLL